MNNRQTIVLIIGAIILLIVIFTAPQVYLWPMPGGGYSRRNTPPFDNPSFEPTIDMPATMLRIVGVVGATFLVWLALKNKKDN